MAVCAVHGVCMRGAVRFREPSISSVASAKPPVLCGEVALLPLIPPPRLLTPTPVLDPDPEALDEQLALAMRLEGPNLCILPRGAALCAPPLHPSGNGRWRWLTRCLDCRP